ncbi:MAG: 50S ribosomal protein L9 [Verrucomicrobia bacterium]|nr:50S ribosomal protein L9 [Verrucomicrobiota bacterium]
MAHSELLLLQPIENLGNEGDQVTVRAGYARNYLLPRKLAVPVTRANSRHINALRERAEKRLAQELEGARAIAAKLEKVSIAFAVQTGPGGKMFGSITAQDLVDRLAQEGISLEKRQVNLYTPVKSLGKHTTRVRLHAEVTVEVDFEVVSENPIEETEEA